MFKFLQKEKWPPDYSNPPWGNAPSIYAHIQAHIDPKKECGLTEGGDLLPDEPKRDPDKVSWAPGALEGAFGHHGSPQAEEEQIQKNYGLLRSCLQNANDKNIRLLYEALKTGGTLGNIDPFIELVFKRRDLDADRLLDLSLWFAKHASDREPVKFAIAMIGILRGQNDLDVLLTLGRHDEFTLYASVAIGNNDECGTDALFKLAKSVDGWGRINTVERLAQRKGLSSEIKDWLIREGFKNSVMYEYLACICARAGDLQLALDVDEINDGLFASTTELISTLLYGEGGPAEGMRDYEFGCEVVQSYLKHGKSRFGSAAQYRLLIGLQKRIVEHKNGERPLGEDWEEAKTNSVLNCIEAVVAQSKWHDVLVVALEDGDRQDFWEASRFCDTLGIDPWPYFYERTEGGEEYWWDLMRLTDEQRLGKVLELAKKIIPLDDLATGASDAMGLEPEYKDHSALGMVLQDLNRFPGKGWEFIEAGLQSPAIRNRNLAIRVLSEWDQSQWPSEAQKWIAQLKNKEPKEDVKTRFEDLLAGRPIS